MNSKLLIPLISTVLTVACTGPNGSTDSNILFHDWGYPHAIEDNGTFYFCGQIPGDTIAIYASDNLMTLPKGETKIICTATGLGRRHFYSPELHKIDGKWYIYFESDRGNTDDHQIYVLENTADNPMDGDWILRGPIVTSDDWNFGIHPTIFQNGGRMYMLWSGWQKQRVESETQCIFIAEMENPWTLKSDRVLISSPDYEWERQWINPDGTRSAYPIFVNENPEVMLSPDGQKIVIAYSASGIWTVYNTLGILHAPTSANILQSSSWTKVAEPQIIQDAPDVYGISNICYITDSKSGKHYVLYQAKHDEDKEHSINDVRIKEISWDSNNLPVFNTGNTCNFSGRSVIAGLWMKVLKDRITPKAEETSEWAPKGNHIKTRWAEEVDPENVLGEYPRPLMERNDWVNLNGLWDYAITDQNGVVDQFEGKILVPFCIESSLSGVCRPLEPGKALWYKREIELPEGWNGKKVLLHFDAVDYDTYVYANGTSGRYMLGRHIGGHTAFSYDVTNRFQNGKVTIYVKVIDNTADNAQPLGKQRRYPNGGGDIFYTSTSGIWQPVWMEAVNDIYVTDIRTTPNIDNGTLSFDISLAGNPTGKVNIDVLDGDNVVASKSAAANTLTSIEIPLENAKLWSPYEPNLYNVKVTVSEGDNVVDEVKSYAAMRKISYTKNEDGYWRMQLNNKDLFQFGPLDQGYWPDGIMTAPTDEALAFDIVKTKEWGFNMIRKHMKVEPARWYYHCDRLGMLVWQDMPSQFRGHEPWQTQNWAADHNCTQDPTVEANFKAEWQDIINQHYSYPCIVVWTPFNEAWGQFKTAEIVDFTQKLDNTRLVNPASGGNHYKLGEGTFVDQHTYDQPIRLWENVFDETRPYVLGEYGGLGRNITGHRWFERNSQTYNTYTSERTITDAYVTLAGQIKDIALGYENNGKKLNYCAAVYTQTTDVETEVNGLMTYDRAVVKFNEARLKEATEALSKVFGEFTGVNTPFVEGVGGDPVYYNIMGVRLDRPTAGVNIVKEADGTVTKQVHTSAQ